MICLSFFYCIFLIICSIILIVLFFKFPKKNINLDFNKNEISVSKSIFHSLSSSLGTGNILGVGVILELFGPGILFWLALQSIVGFFLKFFETYFAIYYKRKDQDFLYVGGPMYYIKYGLNSKLLALCYAILCIFCCFTIGNIIQVKASYISIISLGITNKKLIVSLFVFIIFLSIYKGIKRITSLLEKIVPVMMISYLMLCFYVIYLRFDYLTDVFKLIFFEAFSPSYNKTSIVLLFLYGFLRGTFTNEAGLGSGSIAHGASGNSLIIKESLLEGLTPLIDTLFLCTLTGIVILLSGISLNNGETLFISAINKMIGNNGSKIVVDVLIIVFAFASIIGWYYYGETCFLYLFKKSKKIFIFIFLLVVVLSFYLSLDFAFKLSDISTILLSLINFPVLIILARKHLKNKNIDKTF